jgi:hypothetical protein
MVSLLATTHMLGSLPGVVILPSAASTEEKYSASEGSIMGLPIGTYDLGLSGGPKELAYKVVVSKKGGMTKEIYLQVRAVERSQGLARGGMVCNASLRWEEADS